MHIAELWRHPVKSLQGERLAEAVVENSGLLGDRKWGIVDQNTGLVLTARRVPLLLLASARLTGTGVEIALPGGEVLTGPSANADEVLSKWIGRRVGLEHPESVDAGVGEYFADATDDNGKVESWTMPAGRFVDGFPPAVRLGTAVVQPVVPCERCTMVTRAQPGLDRDLDVFKTLARNHAATFGVWTAVQTPGSVRVGDEVTLGD